MTPRAFSSGARSPRRPAPPRRRCRCFFCKLHDSPDGDRVAREGVFERTVPSRRPLGPQGVRPASPRTGIRSAHDASPPRRNCSSDFKGEGTYFPPSRRAALVRERPEPSLRQACAPHPHPRTACVEASLAKSTAVETRGESSHRTTSNCLLSLSIFFLNCWNNFSPLTATLTCA